ncbi:MAG: 4Fe-4S binding protein [Candidatus Fermentibacteria bacterium]|nr:4Fe-4S binding protein [Candidatus Fermentibacteria bacterium]
MKQFVILLIAASALYAQCPLGFSPDEACTAEAPSCALYSDENGDSLCDNAGPQEQSQPPEEEPEEVTEPDPEPESEPEGEPEVVEEEEPASDLFCPLNLSPSAACTQENAGCTFYTDSNQDGLCDNPGPQTVSSVEETAQVEEEYTQPPLDIEEPEEEVQDLAVEEDIPSDSLNTDASAIDCPLGFSVEEACETDQPLCTLFIDSDLNGVCDNGISVAVAITDTVETETETETANRGNRCPLGYNTSQACDVDNPDCAFYTDSDGNDLCDNPGPGRGLACSESDSGADPERDTVIGCPLGLPPAAACPDSLALCPHWYGVSSHATCSNPAGGSRRTGIVLLTLGVLLPVSTWLSRKFYGRRLKDRLKRNSAHHIIRGVSLMILGFGVQGCFCPLGTFQYAFTSGGLAFLGLSGILIFLLPLVFSAFFGRVFCGWVCPFGALQEFLYRIHVPGRFSPSGKVHSRLKHLSTVILFSLISVILLNRFDVISLGWPAPFCAIDPFHTIFTLFLSGSLVVAGVTIVLSIFIRRFFCKYLCFYGAAQSILAKLTLWNRIKGIRREQPEPDSDEEFAK